MRWSWGFIYALLFLYRCALSIFAQLVVAKLTSLGDSNRYQSGTFGESGSIWEFLFDPERARLASNALTDATGILFHKLFAGNPLAINLGFQTIGFIGIVIMLNSVPPRTRVWLLAILAMPSFNLWSSVAGKEALIVFFGGIICAFVVKLYNRQHGLTLAVLFAILMIYMFKVHFLPALLFLLLGTIICARVKQRTFLALAGGVISLIPLFLFRDYIDEMAFKLIPHFIESEAGSNREAFWVEQYDVFARAPYGMFLAFVGPTLLEARSGILHLASFIESTVMLAILGLFMATRLHSLPLFMIFMSTFTVFWIMFAAYPFGVMNPGSAIRYRTDYLMFILLSVIVLLSRERYVRWLAPAKTAHATTPPTAAAVGPPR